MQEQSDKPNEEEVEGSSEISNLIKPVVLMLAIEIEKKEERLTEGCRL